MGKTRENNILVTCGGKWVGHILQLRQAMDRVPEFRSGKIFVADREPITPAGAFADGSFQVPPVADPAYPAELLRLCKDFAIRLIVPLIDIDVLALAPRRETFLGEGVTIVCPPPDVAELCFDKRAFHNWAETNGIPVPAVVPLRGLQTAAYPLFAKPARGFGSIGARVCYSPEEAQRALEKPGMLLEECLQGPEFSADAYINRAGRSIIRVIRLREKVVGGEAYRSRTVCDADVAAVTDLVLARLAELGHRGPVNVQVIKSQRPAVIDVNPRLGSAVLLSNQATGGRIFEAILQEALGRTAAGNPDDYLEGLQLWRFLGELFFLDYQVTAVYPAPRQRVTFPAEPVEGGSQPAGPTEHPEPVFDESATASKPSVPRFVLPHCPNFSVGENPDPSQGIAKTSMLDAILFDLDDTLYPEITYIRSAFREVADFLAGWGIGAPHEILCLLEHIHWEIDRDRVFQHAARRLRFPQEWIPQLVRMVRAHCPKLHLPPETRQVLSALCRRYRIGIVTDGHREVQRRKIASLEIRDYVDALVVSDELGRPFWKPDPLPFLTACRVLKARPENTLFVGDHPWRDIWGAQQLGMRAIRIRRADGYFRRYPNIAEALPDDEITHLGELFEVLREQKRGLTVHQKECRLERAA